VQHLVEQSAGRHAAVLLPQPLTAESDALPNFAMTTQFRNAPLGWVACKRVCDFVHQIFIFLLPLFFFFSATRLPPHRTADRRPCRRRGCAATTPTWASPCAGAAEIPTLARANTAISAKPSPYPAMDLAAWMEVYLGGQWWTFDPRNNDTRFGPRFLIARGQRCGDVP